MNRHAASNFLVVAILCGGPSALLGNGMRLVSQDAFAAARAEAFVATADNPSAIYYNPAGLTQLEGNNLRAGLYGLYYDVTYRPPDNAPNAGNTYSIEENHAAALQLFYSHSLESLPLSFGLGVYAPYGAGMDWPDDTGFRAVGTESELIYLRFNPVVAVEVLPGFSLGAGVAVDYSKLTLAQGLRPFYLPPNVNSFEFSGDGWTVGYNIGLRWQPHQKVALGVTFRSTSSFTLSGETEVELFGAVPKTRTPAEADFEFPLTVVCGLSYRPTPKWNLEFNADYTDWRSFGMITIHQETRPAFAVPQDIDLTLDWQPSWMYEFGVTRYFDDGWHASAGYLFNENSVPDANYTPLVADLDRHFVGIGFGRRGRHIDFDVTYQFGYGPDHTVTGSQPSTAGQIAGQTADGTYDFVSHAVLVTVGLRF